MTDRSLEEVIHEREFCALLNARASSFWMLCNTLLETSSKDWGKKHYYPLVSEAEALESFLDDFGAQYNRTYSPLREFVASARWFALSGFSLGHLQGRFERYGIVQELDADDVADLRRSFHRAGAMIRRSTLNLLQEIQKEARTLGLDLPKEGLQENDFADGFTRQRLPRNVGQEEIVDEEQRIAEIASKFVAACTMFAGLGVRRVPAQKEREQYLSRVCSEERARVYEAIVHNLQSTYDTHVKNTVLEGQDEKLPRLRGHLSASLHFLEAVTFLTHFVERHDSGSRDEKAERRMHSLVDRAEVQDVILNHLLYWADRFMRGGKALAESLLRQYTNVQELVVELPDDLKLHARPAALIVSIVNRYATPVELEVDGRRCNASSILDVLVTVGSHPEARRYVFRGDENPLRDIGLLFQHGLGEHGMDRLPPELQYLRNA
ncbi:MAG: HPr family phosphocarrier protein [Planctomycetes bacterium]|nr:HPr family phosphocarrier protein [Planctomycetota bacterium]